MIKCIDVYGQFDSKGTDHYYTYPQALSPESRKLFLDPRADLGAFQIGVNVTDLFVIFCTADGWWISIVKRNKHDMRQGYAMFSVCLGANRPKMGAEAVQLLRQGYEQFVDNRVWDNVQTDVWLQTHSLQLTPCVITPFTMPASLADGNNSAYRTFANEAELQQTLTFISQKEYSKYSRIFLLPNTATPVSTGRMQQVTVPVKKEYTIQHTPDTDPSVPMVALDGDTINIVYVRNGLQSEPISYKVSSQHKAAYLDGVNNVIQLQTAQIAGAKFYKRIRLRINGGNIKRFSISRQLKDNEISFDEDKQRLLIPDDLNPNIQGKLQSKGYKDYLLDGKKLSALRNDDELRIEFKPEPISLSLIINGVSYSVNTDNIPLDKIEGWEKDQLVRRLGTTSFQLEAHSNEEETSLAKILQLLGAFFSTLFVIYILYALLCWPMGWKIWPFQHDEAKTTQTTADNSENEPQDTASSFSEVSDTIYLKKEDTWKEKDLKSEQAKQLLTALKNGNIDDVITAHYKCFQGVKAINGHWNKIFDSLNRIVPSSRAAAEAEIRRLCNRGVVNLSELQTALKSVADGSSQSTSQVANVGSAPQTAAAHTASQTNSKDSHKSTDTKKQKDAQPNKSNPNQNEKPKMD